MIVVVTDETIADLSLQVSLTGVDGSEWDLVNGPVRLMSGVSGLGSPDPEHWWQDSPALDGSLRTGSRIPRGEAHLKVRVTASTARQWHDVQTRFMRAIDPSGTAYWSVSTSEQAARTMGLVYATGANTSYEISPFLIRHASYDLEFAQPDPFWRGPTQVTHMNPWLGTVGDRAVENPGDVPAWPKWTLVGPYATATAGVGDALVKMGVAVGQLDARIVDMDPRADDYSVRDLTGASAWSEVVDRQFAQIPPGVSQVRVGHTRNPAFPGGAGASFDLQFTPGYRQAW